MNAKTGPKFLLAIAGLAAILAPAMLSAGFLESDYPGQQVRTQPQPQPQPRPQPQPMPQVDNPATRLIQLVQVGQPIRWGGLVLFPLTVSGAEPVAKIYSLGRANDRGWVTVEEDKPATVAKAVLVNNSNNLVLVLAGELIKGGQQHRSSQKDLLLLPRSRVTIDLYCVEQGRWAEGNVKFDSARALAPQSVRAGNVAGESQAQVWVDVKAFNEAAGVRGQTDSLLAGLDSEKVKSELTDARAKIEPNLPAGTIGLVAGRAGRVFAADIFVDSELFDSFKGMLIDSYATQEVYHKLTRSGEAEQEVRDRIGRPTPVPPTREQARDYLAAARRASYTKMDTPGGGTLWRITGSSTGQALDYRGQAVHVALTTPTPIVRPMPTPRPRPVPMPRPMPEYSAPRHQEHQDAPGGNEHGLQ